MFWFNSEDIFLKNHSISFYTEWIVLLIPLYYNLMKKKPFSFNSISQNLFFHDELITFLEVLTIAKSQLRLHWVIVTRKTIYGVHSVGIQEHNRRLFGRKCMLLNVILKIPCGITKNKKGRQQPFIILDFLFFMLPSFVWIRMNHLS